MRWGHDDVIKWKHFPRYWPFVRGIHRSPVDSGHKDQWCGRLGVFYLCLNKRLSKQSRHRAYYEVIVMHMIYAHMVSLCFVWIWLREWIICILIIHLYSWLLRIHCGMIFPMPSKLPWRTGLHWLKTYYAKTKHTAIMVLCEGNPRCACDIRVRCFLG